MMTNIVIVRPKACPTTVMQAARGSEVYRLIILDLGNRCSERYASRPTPFYLRGKDLRYQLDRRLGGPQSCDLIIILKWGSTPSRTD
jgi:hypothetical protein